MGRIFQMRIRDRAGTEHILLAMLKETESVATRLLYTMGVNIQKLYAAVLAAMGLSLIHIWKTWTKQWKQSAKQEILHMW